MAEIVIKGVALPPKGERLMISVLSNGSVAYKLVSETAEHRTTAQELPTHGDLVDRQKLSKALSKAWNVDYDQDFANKSVWRIVEKEAPTVIPASDGE